MKTSGIILLFLCAGIVVGMCRMLQDTLPLEDISFLALCVSMFCVGVTVGSDETLWRRFKAINPRLALLPLFTIAGTLAGCLAVSVFMPFHRLTDILAVGSGFGYYSLSSVLISDARGAVLGTTALLSNVLREVVTLLLAPLMVRLFGAFSPISSGGATTADTTLPVIMRVSGDRYAVLSVYHGCVVDFSVPFLVTFFCSFPG